MKALYDFAKTLAEDTTLNTPTNAQRLVMQYRDAAKTALEQAPFAPDEIVEKAIERFATSDDTVAFDDPSFISVGEYGDFVSAWVFVEREEADEDSEAR